MTELGHYHAMRAQVDAMGGLVTMREIGRRFDITLTRVQALARRHGWPEPLFYVNGSPRQPLWLWEDIKRWRATDDLTRAPGRPRNVHPAPTLEELAP